MFLHVRLQQAARKGLRAKTRAISAVVKQFASSAARTTHPVVYHDDFCLSPLPPGHRFPMPKDHLLYVSLKQTGLASNTFTPKYPDLDTICLVHDRAYVTSFVQGTISPVMMRQIGLPWSESLVKRTFIGTGSAILAARLAIQYGVACMTNGGTHHAHADHGSGWCIFNDLAVAAKALQRDGAAERILILDLDVHQGDGTASIFANDPTVFTFSIHCSAQSFPKQVNTSDLDIGLPAGTQDHEYLAVLTKELPKVLETFNPDIVLYNAGVDVHSNDSLGKFALTTEGIFKRDYTVFESCASYGKPVACAIGGGYEENIINIVDRHLCLHKAAYELYPKLSQNSYSNKRRRGTYGEGGEHANR